MSCNPPYRIISQDDFASRLLRTCRAMCCRHYAKLNPYLLLQERGGLCDLALGELAHQNTVAITVADFSVSVENGQLLETGIPV